MSTQTHPSKATIIAGLSRHFDADDCAALIARAEKKAAAIYGGRFDHEIGDLIAAEFGCDLVPAANRRMAVMLRPQAQGQAESHLYAGRALAALAACGMSGFIS